MGVVNKDQLLYKAYIIIIYYYYYYYYYYHYYSPGRVSASGKSQHSTNAVAIDTTAVAILAPSMKLGGVWCDTWHRCVITQNRMKRMKRAVTSRPR